MVLLERPTGRSPPGHSRAALAPFPLVFLPRLALLTTLLLAPAVSFTVAAASPSDGALSLAPVFGDHMVLQQQQPIPVWGDAAPGTVVRVELADTAATTTADSSGRWTLTLPARPAGGPHRLSVRASSERLDCRDVMIGEVWLASGQSNMDFALHSARDASAALAAADLPAIRFLRVGQVASRTPRAAIATTGWQRCSPERAGEFSAVAFYFARALHRDRHVAVGIVQATWSGTPGEAWTPAESLRDLPDFRPRVDAIAADSTDWTQAQRETERLDREREEVFAHSSAGRDRGAHRPDFDDSTWPAADYPLDARNLHLPDYAIVWLRQTVDVPATAAGRELHLDLGDAYEWDQTFFNGQLVGSTRWDGPRRYVIPASLVRAGRNVVAVRLFSEWSMGRLGQPGEHPALRSADGRVDLPLSRPWRYHRAGEPELRAGPMFKNEPTALFNGMIAPLAPFALRGVLWYQGEGNAGQPAQYRALLPALIAGWRTRWAQPELPFLIVQLPNIAPVFGPRWPELREAQAAALRLPATGLVVTIDVGDPHNLHPADKRPVGERLHRLARHLVYAEPGPWTGPVLDRVTATGDGALRLTFREAPGGLVTSDGTPVRGFELRGPGGRYTAATATIEGDTVILRSPSVPAPTAARYAWAPDPDANLCNRAGLPAAPFRTE